MKKYTPHNKTSDIQKSNRDILYELYSNSPLPVEEMLINTGLYTRSSALSKLLFLNELYEKILHLPGNILVFGTWWGQDLILLHNLRAIHEPYNFTRKVVGFDTFTGYPAISENDHLSETIKEGAYGTTENYLAHLDALLGYHEKENILSHIRKYQLVSGNILETFPFSIYKIVSKTLGIIPTSNLPINLCTASIGVAACSTPKTFEPPKRRSVYNLKSGVSLISSNII